MNQPTPAIVTQSAVRRLPRIALFLFCVAYVLPGFLGREPWKNADVSAFGVMLEMAAGHSGWWSPQVLGLAVDEGGPLPYWLGAGFIRLLPFFSPEFAARIPFALLLALTLTCTWYTVYHLARQPAAQPVAFAFGGEANPTDYARALADAGLLALVACLGLAQLSHETTPDLARLSLVSLLLFAAARLAHAGGRQPMRSVLAFGIAALSLVFSGAPWIAAILGTGLLVILWLARRNSADGPEPETAWLLEAPAPGPIQELGPDDWPAIEAHVRALSQQDRAWRFTSDDPAKVMESLKRARTHRFFAIRDPKTQAITMLVQTNLFMRYEWLNLEAGISVASVLRQQGYARWGLKWVCAYGRNRGAHFLYGQHAAANMGAQQLIRALPGARYMDVKGPYHEFQVALRPADCDSHWLETFAQALQDQRSTGPSPRH